MSLQVDVVTFGETMLRLSTHDHQLFEQAQSLDFYIGGSESNVAVGLARLGIKTAWFSILPNNQLGHKVKNAISAHGVDTSAVIWSQKGRLGLYWVESGISPRNTSVTYDRECTAISQISPDDLPKNLFSSTLPGILHLSGITLALSASAQATTLQLAKQAKRAGWQVSFDLNYRTKLWDYTTAQAGYLPLLELSDIVFAPYRDIQKVFDIDGSPQQVLFKFYERLSDVLLVMTAGSEGAFAINNKSNSAYMPAFETNRIDPIGAGDAFVAGFLSQIVEHGINLDIALALKWGNACAALKYTIPGDMPLINVSSVISLISDNIDSRNIQR